MAKCPIRKPARQGVDGSGSMDYPAKPMGSELRVRLREHTCDVVLRHLHD